MPEPMMMTCPTGSDPRLRGEHACQRLAGGIGHRVIDRDLIDDLTVDERLEHPGDVAGVDPVHRRTRADDGIEAGDRVLRMLVGSSASAMAFVMYAVEPDSSAAATVSRGHSGWTMTRTFGCSVRALSIWAGAKRLCTEQKPCHRMTRASSRSSTVLLPRGRAGFHSGISSSPMPIFTAVLRPRCWSGKNRTR